MMVCYFNSEKSIKIIHYISRLKQKYYMIVSIDVEKTFDKIKHLFNILHFSSVPSLSCVQLFATP